MPEFTEDNVLRAYRGVTGLEIPDESWNIFWPIAQGKVLSDGFRDDSSRIVAACYQIAYLASARNTGDNSGRKISSISKSVGGASKSITYATGSADGENEWLVRYNALLASTVARYAGGKIVSLRPPLAGYRDPVTRRRVIAWWKRGGRL